MTASILAYTLAGIWIAASLTGCQPQGSYVPQPVSISPVLDRGDGELYQAELAIKEGRLEEAEQHLEALSAARAEQGAISCRVLKDLAFVALMRDPVKMEEVDSHLRTLTEVCTEEIAFPSPWAALIRGREQALEERRGMEHQIRQLKAQLTERGRDVESLEKEVSDLRFQLHKITEIHRQTEEKRRLSKE